jgi:hypothetical protein
MDSLSEHGIISEDADNEEWERVLDRLRRNDPTLKELTLGDSAQWHWELAQLFIKAKEYWTKLLNVFDAIATNSSLKILNFEGDIGFCFIEDIQEDRARRAFSLNTSLKDIRITKTDWSTSLLDIVMASPNLEFMTIRFDSNQSVSIEAFTAMVQVLCGHMNLHSLTIVGFQMDSDIAAAFATAFQGNQTIKTLIMRRDSVHATSAVSFVESLPHDNALEVLVFDEHEFNDDSLVRIVRTVCRTRLKVLSLATSSGHSEISQEGCTRIIQTLNENEHSLTKLDLFRDSQDSMWHNFARLEIEHLTWNNRLQVEKETWIDQFLNQDATTKELLFRALERAKKVDNEQFSKAPNILFYLIKESPDFIAEAIRDGL